jgi:AcrR family transcriptional regulator
MLAYDVAMEPVVAQLSERKDARANRERILLAAREEFARRGLSAEMKDIADRAGVGVGTLYRNFESREALIAAIITQTRLDLLARMREAVAADAPAEAFRAIIRAGAAVHMEFGALMEVAMAENVETPSETKAQFTALFDELLRRGKAAGVFRKDIDDAVLLAAIEAIFSSGKLLEIGVDRGSVAAADGFADLFLRGCRIDSLADPA